MCFVFVCKGQQGCACGSVAKFACSPQGNALQAQVFKTRHPWCKICIATRYVANGIVIVWFAKMPPRGAVLVVLCLLHKVGCLWKQTPVANVLAHGGGELFAPMAVCFGTGCGKVPPRGAVLVFCGQISSRWQKRAGGVFGQIAIKKSPRGGKNALFACSCGAKWWQGRNWLPLQKHAHGVGVQSVSDVGCGVSVGGRGSVFSSAVQVLH